MGIGQAGYQACLASSSCHSLSLPALAACLLLGLGGCWHAKCPCQGIFGSLRQPLCLPLRASLLTSRLVAFGKINAPLQATRAALFFQISWSYLNVMGGWVVLCKIISPAFISRLPENFELALLYSILKPIESHVNCFTPLLPHCAIDDTTGSSVASFHRCGGLWVP